MSVTNKKLLPSTALQLTTSAVTYYTVPVNTKTIVKKLTFTNTSGSAATVTVYFILSGGSAADNNTLTKTKTIASLETWTCAEAEGHVMDAGSFIQMLASAATAITPYGSGVEIT